MTTAMQLALVGSGYALMATLRLRTEEAAGRAELVLAGALPRVRWMASWVGLAALGSAVSPFQHVPEVPAAGFDAVPLVGLTVGRWRWPGWASRPSGAAT